MCWEFDWKSKCVDLVGVQIDDDDVYYPGGRRLEVTKEHRNATRSAGMGLERVLIGGGWVVAFNGGGGGVYLKSHSVRGAIPNEMVPTRCRATLA